MVVIISNKAVAGEEAKASDVNVQGNNLNLRAEAQSTGDDTIKIKAGLLMRKGNLILETADIDSTGVPSPAANPRIDVFSLTSTGGLTRTAGTEAVSPIIPTIPDDEYAIQSVFVRVSTGVIIKDTDDSTNSYLLQDLRGQQTTDEGQVVVPVISNGAISAGKAVFLESSTGRVDLADSDAAESSLGFMGFAFNGSTGAGEQMFIVESGVARGFSGLSTGSYYYVGSTGGEIQLDAGTFPMQVGRAISATELLIDKGARIMSGVVADFSGTAIGNNDVTVTCGFKPKFIKLHYFIQGHDPSTSFNQYLGRKGIAEFIVTTLGFVNDFWLTPDTVGNGLSGDDGVPQTAVTAMLNTPNSTGAVTIGVDAVNGSSKKITISVNSVSNTGFVIRRLTENGTAPGGIARAKIAWEAYA